jgi:hypothetical protein
MQRMMALGFSICCLHILIMSSLVSLAMPAVTVEMTPGKSMRTIRGREGPGKKMEYEMSRVFVKKPLTVREMTSVETVRSLLIEFRMRSSISLRKCCKSDSWVRSNSRLLSRNWAMWYGPSLRVTSSRGTNNPNHRSRD